MSNEIVVQETTTAVAKIDNGKPALYNPAAFDQIWRASKLFSSSDLVPAAYKGKPENCFIAIEMADRMGISPFAMLQSLVIIQGKPSMEAKLIVALVNDSGIFADPLEYEIFGDDPYAKNYKVRCFATIKKTGKVCLGPWITYQMVEGEGWLSKQGSKWKTMPSIMFMYRAASYFAKVYCPNITMGMQTREELEDIKPINITPDRKEAPALVEPAETPKTVVIDSDPASEKSPTLVAPTVEIVDEQTGEVIKQPTVETAEQKQTRNRRTRAQIEADKQAAQQDDGPPAHILDSNEDDFPDPPGGIPEEPPHPAAASNEPAESEPMGDLF